MHDPTRLSARQRMAQQVRARFVQALDATLPELADRLQAQLAAATQDGKLPPAQMQQLLEAQAAFRRERENWLTAVRRAQQTALRGASAPAISDLGALSLMDDEVVERKILASRLAVAITETASAELNDLRLRMESLEHSEPGGKDVLMPETFTQHLLQAWADCGLSRPMWQHVHADAAKALALRFADIYRQLNAALAAQGVEAQIDMRKRVRRADDGAAAAAAARTAPGSMGGGAGQDSAPAPLGPQGQGGHGWAGSGPMGGGHAGHAGHAGHTGHIGHTGHYADSRLGPHTQTPYVRPSALAQAEQETRMLTGISPMVRIRQRAQGVLVQLRRLVSNKVAHFGDDGAITAPSSALETVLSQQPAPIFEATEWMERMSATAGVAGMAGMAAVAPSPAQMQERVQVMADHLRQNAIDLKAKAEKPNEKATIEVVALMFQAILAEERIPASIRVWFARLQIPVLRLALAEPDFFASVQHPARQLIDSMGACVMGFDAAQVLGSQLEREIKRIVQVIEQYPETGRRVYQLVLGEFKKFLGRSLTESENVQQAATLAQQVEQKEALSIQYTIELRRMLGGVPAPDDVREFLFRIWAEVLALSTVRRGAHDEQTLRFKQAAADLLWVVCPKTDRADRARVVQKLSGLLSTLREGMELLVMIPEEQDGHIKLINDAVMKAFMSRGEGLSPEKLDELSQALAGLEDEVTDDPEGDLLLDPGMLELMFGIGSDMLEVIAQGGSMPNPGMLQWAGELELGSWFTLERQGQLTPVQYVWRSQRGQLHLFAHMGRSYLVQTRRLAAYLQAGLLVPSEEESLTVRATRQALAKLSADPEQLLR